MGNVTIISATFETADDGRIYGWIPQPDTRGTFDILTYCLLTIFICSFSILCLNVPTPDETSWQIFRRRLFWMATAISGPEFVLTYASAQWGMAKASVKDFKDAGYEGWTMRHAFFADMGGFVLVATDCEKPFPITAKHVHWLVTHQYLTMPDTTVEEINDKSKQDTIAKVVTFFQNSYLVLQCISRYEQGLTITTLELSALAIVICSLMTSWCWWRKPSDVATPFKLRLKEGATIDSIRETEGGDALKPWDHTPLDFIDDLRPSWALNVQKFMKMPVNPHERPIPRLHNDRLPSSGTLTGIQKAVLCFGSLLYAAIHLLGWNFEFPTRVELILWRVSSMFLFGNTVAFWIFETSAGWWRRGFWQRWFYTVFWKSKLPSLEANLQRRDTSAKSKELPLKFEFWSIFPLAWTYALARLYLIVESFMGLRAMDPTAYANVAWTTYLPHF